MPLTLLAHVTKHPGFSKFTHTKSHSKVGLQVHLGYMKNCFTPKYSCPHPLIPPPPHPFQTKLNTHTWTHHIVILNIIVNPASDGLLVFKMYLQFIRYLQFICINCTVAEHACREEPPLTKHKVALRFTCIVLSALKAGGKACISGIVLLRYCHMIFGSRILWTVTFSTNSNITISLSLSLIWIIMPVSTACFTSALFQTKAAG